MSLTILQGDALTELRRLPNDSVHCCATSPPYWGLRDYGTARWEGGDPACDHLPDRRGGRFATPVSNKQASNEGSGTISKRDCSCGAVRVDQGIGLEATPELWVARLVEVFREVRRVLHPSGTCWINCGDAYSGGGRGGNPGDSPFIKQKTNEGSLTVRDQKRSACKDKDLIGLPWMLAFALRADGWWLRSEIIWHKPNPMPESVTDRPTKSHEQVFLLSKSTNYFYDAEAVREPASENTHVGYASNGDKSLGREGEKGVRPCSFDGYRPALRNKRSVWSIASEPLDEPHFAAYPTALVKPMILAGTSAKGCCPKCGAPWERIVEPTPEYAKLIGKSVHDHDGDGLEYGMRQGGKGPLSGEQTRAACPNGTYRTIGWQSTCEHENFPPVPCTVLDPFAGTGTTCLVALELGRRAIGIELSEKYCQIARRRCNVTPGLQLA